MQRQRQDDSSAIQMWLEVVDTVLDLSEAVGELLLEGAASVTETAGALLFALLD